MSTAKEIIAEIQGERAKRDAEEVRWRRFRNAANPPIWAAAAAGIGGIGLMIMLAAALLRRPEAIRNPMLVLAPVVAGAFALAGYFRTRRERTLVGIIREEAPELYQKLKDEGIVR